MSQTTRTIRAVLASVVVMTLGYGAMKGGYICLRFVVLRHRSGLTDVRMDHASPSDGEIGSADI